MADRAVKLREALLELCSGGHREARPWAALALGMHAAAEAIGEGLRRGIEGGASEIGDALLKVECLRQRAFQEKVDAYLAVDRDRELQRADDERRRNSPRDERPLAETVPCGACGGTGWVQDGKGSPLVASEISPPSPCSVCERTGRVSR